MNDPRRTRPFSLQNLIPYPDGVADTVIKYEGKEIQEFERCSPTFTRPLVKALNAAFHRGAQDGMDRITDHAAVADVARARQLKLTDDTQYFLSVQADKHEGKTRLVAGVIKHSNETEAVFKFDDFICVEEIRLCIRHFQMAYDRGLEAGTEFGEAMKVIQLAVG